MFVVLAWHNTKFYKQKNTQEEEAGGGNLTAQEILETLPQRNMGKKEKFLVFSGILFLVGAYFVIDATITVTGGFAGAGNSVAAWGQFLGFALMAASALLVVANTLETITESEITGLKSWLRSVKRSRMNDEKVGVVLQCVKGHLGSKEPYHWSGLAGPGLQEIEQYISVNEGIETALELLPKDADEEMREAICSTFEKMTEQRNRYKRNERFIRGIDKIESLVKKDLARYYEATPQDKSRKTDSSFVKGATRERLVKRWREALDRREKYFEFAPELAGRPGIDVLAGSTLKERLATIKQNAQERNLKGRFDLEEIRDMLRKGEVSDVPDWGLYDYVPYLARYEGNKTDPLRLKVVHYTDEHSLKRIKEKYLGSKTPDKRIFFLDKSGWTYFMGDLIPESDADNLRLTSLRNIIGTGHQDYAERGKLTNPETYVSLTIEVPKERIFFKETIYDKSKGQVVKYDDKTEVTVDEVQGTGTSGVVGKDKQGILDDVRKKLETGEYMIVRKYAIAGGIALNDIVPTEEIYSRRYNTKGKGKINPHLLKKDEWVK